MNQSTYKNCTNCKYCESVCPEQTPIATIMGLFQEIEEKNNFEEVKERFNSTLRKKTGCINCGRCLVKCKEKINIPYYILEAKEEFE